MRATTERLARDVFGWEGLLPGQAEAVDAVAGGRDTLIVFPTGSGKSAVYQLAGLRRGGVTVVVSPLLALQRDQIASIDEAPDAPAAVAISSGVSARGTRRAWAAVESGEPVYVFLAPEQFANPEVLDRLAAADVRLFVVDEAHCVSSWGHDFRPDYLRLSEAIDALRRPPVLALTATASTPVREEIVARLGLRDPLVEVRGIDRPEIHLAVQRHEDDARKRRGVLETALGEEGATLVYVATRRDTERYAAELTDGGRPAVAYHGAMPRAERARVHDGWRAGRTPLVVATSAFGMGVDRADVRLVVHAAVPDSLDAYVQEIGRAGRDRAPARAVLHYRPEDLGLRRFFAAGTLDDDDVERVWAALRAAAGPVRVRRLGEEAGVSPRAAARILNALVDAGHVRSDARGHRPVGDAPAAAVAAAARESEEAQGRIRSSRIDVMRRYAEATGCRRGELLAYFGIELDAPCGACDRCEEAAADPAREPVVRGAAASPTGRPVDVDEPVTHREWGAGVVTAVEEDRMTIFFADRGYKVIALTAIEDGVVARGAGAEARTA